MKKLVVTSSFHGTALSIVYGKRFWSIDGALDARISNILKTFDLLSRSIDESNYKNVNYLNESIDYKEVYKTLELERKNSEDFILNSLSFDLDSNENKRK